MTSVEDDDDKTAMDLAIDRMVRDSHKYAFAKAHWLPKIIGVIKTQKAPEHYSVFKTYELPWVADAVERLIHKDDTTRNADENMFFKTFAAWSDPTVDRKAGKECKYLNWICKNWVDTPTTWEGLDLIRETLFYFDQMSGRLHKAGLPNQIDQVSGFDHLSEIMMPCISERLQRQAQSTTLYSGPEGKIIVPHTMDAAKHIGMQTKWCVSARKAKNYFDIYNPDGPIIMYLPQATDRDQEGFPKYTSFKFAATCAELRDELDKEKAVLPETLRRLAAAVTGDEATYLNAYGKREQILASRSQMPEAKTPKASRIIGPYFDFYRKYYFDEVLDRKTEIPEDYWKDPDFFTLFSGHEQAREKFPPEFFADPKLAIQMLEDFHISDLKGFDQSVRENQDVIHAYLTRNPRNLDRLPSKLADEGANISFARELVLKQAHEKRFLKAGLDIPSVLSSNRTFAEECVALNPYYLASFDWQFGGDMDLVLSALSQKWDAEDNMGIHDDLLALRQAQAQDPDILLKAVSDLRAGKTPETPAEEMAFKTITNGYGLSPHLVPVDLMANINEYVRPAIEIAIQRGYGENLRTHLRFVPKFQGRADAVICPKRALFSLQSQERRQKKAATVKLSRP